MAVTYLKTPDAMVPVSRDADKFKQYKDGKYYDLEEARERSIQSHNLYFKAVGITWLNLPERNHQPTIL